MAFLEGLLGKKNALSAEDLGMLFKILADNRDPVIITSQTFKFTSEVLEVDDNIFHLRNTLSRDEVMFNLKGHDLQLQVPYELTLYKGATTLKGLGMVKRMHSLKFTVPDALAQDESRGAVRISTFPGAPHVTFTSDDLQLVKGQLLDISMSGAGIRPDLRWSNSNKLNHQSSVIYEIKIGDEVSLSGTATVRHFMPNKMGIQFQELDKTQKQNLFKFIVKWRKVEQREAINTEKRYAGDSPFGKNEETPAEPIRSSGKPTALIVGEDKTLVEWLNSALSRKFDTMYCPFLVSELRHNLEIAPSLTLLEVKSNDLANIAKVKKIGSLILPKSPLMYYGKNFTAEVRDRFRGHDRHQEILIDLENPKKLLVFKQIENYYNKKGRVVSD